MMLRSSLTPPGLVLIWFAGLMIAIGSKSYDPDEDIPVEPVIVDFSVSNSGFVSIENGSSIDNISSLTISGSFEKGGNSAITLRDVPVAMDTNTSFAVSLVAAEGDDLLEGAIEVEVTEVLEFGLDRLPGSGQLSLVRNGTTTLITFDGNASNVVIAVGSTTLSPLSFSDFRALFSDKDRDLDTRFASKAYRTLETLWLMTRFSETAQQTISSNLDTLESMGFNMSLSLTCSNAGGTPAPAYSVTWTVDPAGAGLGSPGDDDTFEYSWTNCQFNSDDRYLQGLLQIANYQLNNDITPRSMSYSGVYSTVLIAEEAIESTPPSLTRSRISGTLVVSATEGATVTTTQNQTPKTR